MVLIAAAELWRRNCTHRTIDGEVFEKRSPRVLLSLHLWLCEYVAWLTHVRIHKSLIVCVCFVYEYVLLWNSGS